MIGYAVEVSLYNAEGEERRATALLTLDVDGDEPQIDLRLMDEEHIANVGVDDLEEAVIELRRKRDDWQRERKQQQVD